MPIEIRELIIKASVSDSQTPPHNAGVGPQDKEEIIAECVDQIMQIIKDKEER